LWSRARDKPGVSSTSSGFRENSFSLVIVKSCD
jgi:hypothetical protein